MKRAACILISIILVVCFCGCKQNATDLSGSVDIDNAPTHSTGKQQISLLYSYTDKFDPYMAKTNANREIASLLYDSLVKTNNNFEPIYVLAESVEIVDNVCTVRLKTATFTDGSTVTASDVIYSYNTAKNTARYAHNFYEVVSASAVDTKTVKFALSQHDPYFANLLSFPIVKSGSSGVCDGDGKEIPPIGCGKYKISENRTGLERNENYYGKKGVIKNIGLINSPDEASTSHYVEIGAADMYYTDGGDIVRMSGKKAEVNLNRMVYIGVNDSYGSLASREMRYAISSALDRDVVCKTAYYNNAIPATGFFNPKFAATKSIQTIDAKPDFKITVENLSKIGYNNMNSNGYYANSAGNNPVFSLLVNSENSCRVIAAKQIAAQCKTAGIQINVVECTYEQYVTRLQSGSFQLYLGEVQLLDNMDMTQLVVSGGSAAYGINNKTPENPTDNSNPEHQILSTPPCKAILDNYHTAQCGISDVAATLLTEMPQIPVCFLEGVLFYNSAIKGGIEASASDVYLNFENYEF